MPQTGALLTAQEREAFAAWLTAVVERSGVPKSEIAVELGDRTSTQLVNRYLRRTIPTLPVLKKIVRAVNGRWRPPSPSGVGGLWAMALLRAGYFRELLILIDALRAIDGARADMVRLAVMAFPRRDVGPFNVAAGAAAIELNDSVKQALPGGAFWYVNFDHLATKLHPLLRHASNALTLPDVELPKRRRLAADAVNEWADQVDPDLAERERDKLRSELIVVDPQKTPQDVRITSPSRRTRP